MITDGEKWCSVIDLSNAFFSIPLNPSCQYKFAFTLKNCQLSFTRVPQGFHNTPLLCHRFMSCIWYSLGKHDRQFVFNYVDDILVATKTQDENLRILDLDLEIISKAGFIVNLSKVQLVKRGALRYPFGGRGSKTRVTACRFNLRVTSSPRYISIEVIFGPDRLLKRFYIWICGNSKTSVCFIKEESILEMGS